MQPKIDATLVADADFPRQGGQGAQSGQGGQDALDRPITQVAVGILIHHDGSFLLTSRPSGKAYAGYWEFPGGKLEAGETVHDALVRELHEELGIHIAASEPWKVATVDYPHALVCLNFCKVRAWNGPLEMREGQEYSWQRLPVQVLPILPGAVPVLEWLGLEAC